MLCEICHENEARITYTEIINGVKKEQHLCEKCAAKQSPFSNIAGNFKIGPDVPFGNILSGLLQSFAKGLGAMQEKESICGRCGMTASEFAKTGRLGCPNCYSAFAPILDKNLKTLQGAIENKGKRPMNAVYFEPLNYDPSQVPDAKEQDIAGTTGSVIGTAGTIDDILGTREPEKTGTVRRGRKKAAQTDDIGKESKTSGTKRRTAKSAGSGKDKDAAIDKKPGRKGTASKNAAGKPDTPQIAVLRKKMDKAVKEENYEEAAKLRDRIHELEKS